MAGEVTYVFRDFSNEASSSSLQSRQATAANFDAITGELDTLQTAIIALSTGELQRRLWNAQITEISGALPTDPYAQRERKWLVRIVDAVGNKATMEIPCADLDDPTVLSAGTDEANMAHADWVAFAAAVDDIFEHRSSGELLTVLGATLVGRNI